MCALAKVTDWREVASYQLVNGIFQVRLLDFDIGMKTSDLITLDLGTFMYNHSSRPSDSQNISPSCQALPMHAWRVPFVLPRTS